MAHNTPSKKDLKGAILLAGFTVLAVFAIGAFAIFTTVGGGGNTGGAKSFKPNQRGLLPVGSQAPDFTAETIDGDSVSPRDAGGKGATMLVFFASWCPHCNKEAPLISDLESEHQELRVVMVGIDDQDSPGKVREFVNRYGITGPALYDPSLGSIYQVPGYPTIYVLDSSAEIVAAHSGEAPRDVLEGWIGAALNNGG